MAGKFTRSDEDDLTPKQIRQIQHRKERRRTNQDLRDFY